MKCTIKSIRAIELSENRNGCRIEGFIPVSDMLIIPTHILKWIRDYEGVKAVPYEDGIFVASWGETVCSDKDQYDAVRGAHLAESKAKVKIYRFVRNFADHMSNYFDVMSGLFQEDYLKYDHCVEHEEEHANYLGNKYND